MEIRADTQPDFESLKCLLLDIAQQRSLEDLLQLIVRRLGERPEVALVRIWLIQPGDICSSCHMRAECPDQTSCLHLVASAGRPVAEENADWSRLDGGFRRIPLGVRKVGHIGGTGEPIIVKEIERDSAWIARPDWARHENIRGFHGQPIIYKGEVLGVLAVFSRTPVADEAPVWLRMIADHVAVAIANTRALQEIERLQAQLELENTYLREEVLEAQAFGDIVGQSPALHAVLRQIELVAPTDAGVLILGESGTGKELVAREIHKRSLRNKKPMVRVNCASIPRELYESEFFGHVRGAFTGAFKDRAGRFEVADGGTLFLDEVGEIPLDLQSKLLRVLQEQQYERVGEEKTRQVNVRVIAATNRDLKKEVEAGRFRQDLFYRLNVFPIEVAPIRERKEDIPVLAANFLDMAAKKLNCSQSPRLTQAHVIKLQNYDWPGNARELQNVLERAIILSRCGNLQIEVPQASGIASPLTSSRTRSVRSPKGEVIPESEMRRQERDNILAALEQTNWKVYGSGGTAELLQIKPTTLVSRMHKMGLKKPG
ncbi:MAG: sigma 54-interacting transcriptional regulator [Nitrospirota bacterium]|nr:sigma 54-interacting transcriptional regulator [Nitrospirota bacterium]